MSLRSSLEPKEPGPAIVKQLKDLAILIEDGLDAGRDMTAEITEFNSISGRETSPNEFQAYSGSTSLDVFVREVCTVHQNPTPAITREELVEIVRRIVECEGAEWEQTYYVSLLKANVLDPEVTDLIFWSNEDLTPAQIVDRALAFKAQPMPERWD